MIEIVTGWFPKRRFMVIGDRAYAAGPALEELPENVEAAVRMKKNNRFYDLPGPRKPGRRGPNRKKGKKLPLPKEMIKSKTGWKQEKINFYGSCRTVKIKSMICLWWGVLKEKRVKLVLVLDEQKDRWAVFLCTDIERSAKQIVEMYCLRWSLEILFRDAKQFGGADEAQCRTEEAVARQTPFNLGMMSVVQVWYLEEGRMKRPLRTETWQSKKEFVSFQKMLSLLRWQIREEELMWKWGIDPTSGEKAEVDREQIEEIIARWARAG